MTLVASLPSVDSLDVAALPLKAAVSLLEEGMPAWQFKRLVGRPEIDELIPRLHEGLSTARVVQGFSGVLPDRPCVC